MAIALALRRCTPGRKAPTMAGLLKTVVGDVGQAAHMLGNLSLDPTCLMLMAASADCALKAVAFRAQVRAAGGGATGTFPRGWNHSWCALEPGYSDCYAAAPAPASSTPALVAVLVARVYRSQSESGATARPQPLTEN